MLKRFAVLGSGAWGTAIAMILAQNPQHHVALWSARPEHAFTWHARRENVRGAFEVLKPDVIRDRAVIVIDDVMTTGATLSACAAALKRSGARYVVALTLAHATAQFPDIGYDGP